MPELPDISAYLSALQERIVGQPLERVRINSAFLLRTASPPIADAAGRVVTGLRRIGKRVAIGLDNDLWLVLHMMIAGRLHWRPRGAKLGGREKLAGFCFSQWVIGAHGGRHQTARVVARTERPGGPGVGRSRRHRCVRKRSRGIPRGDD